MTGKGECRWPMLREGGTRPLGLVALAWSLFLLRIDSQVVVDESICHVLNLVSDTLKLVDAQGQNRGFRPCYSIDVSFVHVLEELVKRAFAVKHCHGRFSGIPASQHKLTKLQLHHYGPRSVFTDW